MKQQQYHWSRLAKHIIFTLKYKILDRADEQAQMVFMVNSLGKCFLKSFGMGGLQSCRWYKMIECKFVLAIPQKRTPPIRIVSCHYVKIRDIRI